MGSAFCCAGTSLRSTSPVPPTANFMQPPAQAPAPVVDAIIDLYHQSFPGERRSRSNSRRTGFNAQWPTVAPPQGQGQSQGNLLERPVSREGHPAIGANGVLVAHLSTIPLPYLPPPFHPGKLVVVVLAAVAGTAMWARTQAGPQGQNN